MSVPASWIENRRGDGELLGWIRPAGSADGSDGFIATDLLGHDRTDPVEWLEAEETLEGLGIGYLADPYELLLEDGRWLRVRITEASSERVRVKRDDWGAIDIPLLEYTVAFPVPEGELRPVDPAVPVVLPGV